jgi:hypothetical protein
MLGQMDSVHALKPLLLGDPSYPCLGFVKLFPTMKFPDQNFVCISKILCAYTSRPFQFSLLECPNYGSTA